MGASSFAPSASTSKIHYAHPQLNGQERAVARG
jgi:hypothetical protein